MKVLIIPTPTIELDYSMSSILPIRESQQIKLIQQAPVSYHSNDRSINGIGCYYIGVYKGRFLFTFLRGVEKQDNDYVITHYYRRGVCGVRPIIKDFIEVITGDNDLAEAIVWLDEQDRFIPHELTKIVVVKEQEK